MFFYMLTEAIVVVMSITLRPRLD